MHTVNFAGKTDDELITITTNASRTAGKWDEAKQNLGLKKSIAVVRNEVRRKPLFEKETPFDKPKSFKNTFQECRKDRSQSN